jgi:hypothetical protein
MWAQCVPPSFIWVGSPQQVYSGVSQRRGCMQRIGGSTKKVSEASDHQHQHTHKHADVFRYTHNTQPAPSGERVLQGGVENAWEETTHTALPAHTHIHTSHAVAADTKQQGCYSTLGCTQPSIHPSISIRHDLPQQEPECRGANKVHSLVCHHWCWQE